MYPVEFRDSYNQISVNVLLSIKQYKYYVNVLVCYFVIGMYVSACAL